MANTARPINGSVAVKQNLSAIIFRPHREVHPIGCAPFLEYELVELSPSAISDIQQYRRHADHHLRPIAVDIHRASSQMIRALCTITLPIHLLTPIAAVDDDGNLMSRITIQLVVGKS